MRLIKWTQDKPGNEIAVIKSIKYFEPTRILPVPVCPDISSPAQSFASDMKSFSLLDIPSWLPWSVCIDGSD